MGTKCKLTTAVEGCLPWRRDKIDYPGTVSFKKNYLKIKINFNFFFTFTNFSLLVNKVKKDTIRNSFIQHTID